MHNAHEESRLVIYQEFKVAKLSCDFSTDAVSAIISLTTMWTVEVEVGESLEF